jgi:putative oxidoreductase
MKKYIDKIPEFCLSHWLLRIPLSVVFIQQGLSKFPITADDASAFDLPYIVWWFAAYGELGAGIGLLVGGLAAFTYLHLDHPWVEDVITRFSGIVICCIMTGVIWIGEPDSLLDVLLYDNLHVLLWVGGLFFALRGRLA